jgi:hypothetical protein
MLRIKSTIYLTGQANSNDRNSKSQTKKQSLTRRKRLRCALNRFAIWSLRFDAWNLRFICNLVLGIWDFKKSVTDYGYGIVFMNI